MGSNMQRQAVSLIRPEAPLVGTGVERNVARDSGQVILAKANGVVKEADASHIKVLYTIDGKNIEEDYEVRDWAKHFGVSEEELRKAVEAAGPIVKNVERHLRR